MPRIPRSDLLARFRAMKARGEPIIGAGAGTGISAKGEEHGGADLIVIYNSGRYRMAGRGSLAGMMPYGDANGVVLEMAREVLPVVAKTPVLAGVCGTDPFRQMDLLLDEVLRLGFSGVQNFPTVGLIDGRFRAGLEETGMGYACEVEMIAKARARPVDDPLCVRSDAGRGNGTRRRRRPGLPLRSDRRRLHRRGDVDALGAVSGADRRDGRGGAGGKRRRPHPRARGTDRRTGRRRVCPDAGPPLPRLLWGIVDGALAGGARALRPGCKIQSDQEGSG